MMLSFLLLTPKMKAIINPASIIENKIIKVHKFTFRTNLVVENIRNAAVIKEILQRIGMAIFLLSRESLIISPHFYYIRSNMEESAVSFLFVDD